MSRYDSGGFYLSGNQAERLARFFDDRLREREVSPKFGKHLLSPDNFDLFVDNDNDNYFSGNERSFNDDWRDNRQWRDVGNRDNVGNDNRRWSWQDVGNTSVEDSNNHSPTYDFSNNGLGYLLSSLFELGGGDYDLRSYGQPRHKSRDYEVYDSFVDPRRTVRRDSGENRNYSIDLKSLVKDWRSGLGWFFSALMPTFGYLTAKKLGHQAYGSDIG